MSIEKKKRERGSFPSLLSFFVNWCELSSWFGDQLLKPLTTGKKRESNRINGALLPTAVIETRKQMKGGRLFWHEKRKGWKEAQHTLNKGENKKKRNLVCYFFASQRRVMCLFTPFLLACAYWKSIPNHWRTLGNTSAVCTYTNRVYAVYALFFISYPRASC